MKRSDIPSLDDLRALESVVRLGSVRAAASELSLTHGAVSRRVNKLAADLALPLLEPDRRGIRPTEAGSRLAATTGDALKLLGTTLGKLRAEAVTQPIVLSCERSLAMCWLIPRLSGFQDQHPDVVVHLSTGGGALDFARDHVSLAIRRLDFPVDPSWNVTPLVSEKMGPVMPPDMLQQFQSGDYIALGSKTRPNAWRQWLDAHPGSSEPREIRLMDHHFLMLESAASGLGVALSPLIIANDDIQRSRLIAPMGFDSDGSTYALLHTASLEITHGLLAVRTWLLHQAALSMQ
ncbi:LysR family transcriptional regulator [Novacetimonas hansenii]|uniref:LysR family transcriptional regulator n=1 Tax=Novacetimonas hansenii TaxID=436 RepID=UPI000789B75E|nr:LysR family transcriptional regulator [Novacetimonas hansenii]RFO99759.1 transcriptional regulator [Novacetimonas hansenii]WEQ58262.1 LysR family transcriptional regulator [Novacetimonas hansenii]CUW48596.1 HTH-type transcriptional activator AmpR [Novacetimonas hansenii]